MVKHFKARLICQWHDLCCVNVEHKQNVVALQIAKICKAIFLRLRHGEHYSGIASRTQSPRHYLCPGQADITTKHGSRRAKAKLGTSYWARGTGACPTDNLEKMQNIWFHSLQKKGHDKNYRLPVGQTLFLNKSWVQKSFHNKTEWQFIRAGGLTTPWQGNIDGVCGQLTTELKLSPVSTELKLSPVSRCYSWMGGHLGIALWLCCFSSLDRNWAEVELYF